MRQSDATKYNISAATDATEMQLTITEWWQADENNLQHCPNDVLSWQWSNVFLLNAQVLNVTDTGNSLVTSNTLHLSLQLEVTFLD